MSARNVQKACPTRMSAPLLLMHLVDAQMAGIGSKIFQNT